MYEEIYRQNEGLLRTMARRYSRACAMDRAVSEEDLMQAGFAGLMRAAQTYDPGAGKTWGSWACWHIRQEFDAALGLRRGRATRTHTGADTLDRSTARTCGETLGDLLPDEALPGVDEALLLEELRQAVRQAVGRLEDARQRQLVERCALRGQSLRQAAAALGISEAQARRLGDRARIRLARDGRLREIWGDRRTGC